MLRPYDPGGGDRGIGVVLAATRHGGGGQAFGCRDEKRRSAGADAGGKIKTGMDEASDATKKARGHTEKFTISWQTISRVVMTQMIVRAMSQVRDALHEAAEASIEFQQHIAEIQTVAPQIGGTFASLSNEAAEFAKQFNVPLAQATEGLYQTISDQFSGDVGSRQHYDGGGEVCGCVMDFEDATTSYRPA